MSEHFLELSGVVKSFGAQTVHKGLDLKVKAGKTSIVVGQSGAGKSVMLKYFTGLLKPDEGRVMVAGVDLCQLKRKELMEVRSRVSYLFQGVALFDSLTVFDNVALPLREKTKLTESEIRKQVLMYLDMVAMGHAVSKYPSELSGGMQKRVGLARALQRNPDVVLFDEPTTGLDPETTFNIYNLFDDMQKALGYTALIVSHDIPKVFRIADEVAVLKDGIIEQIPTPSVSGQTVEEPWLKKMMQLEVDSLKGVLF